SPGRGWSRWSGVVRDGGGEEDVRRVERAREPLCAGGVVDEERLGPARAAVGRSKDATVARLHVHVTLSGDEDDTWIRRIDEHGRDLLGRVETEMPPRHACIDGLPDAIPFVDRAAGDDVA